MLKFIFIATLIALPALAQTDLENLDQIEVGSPKDCAALGNIDDQQRADERHDLQQKVMNCLGPKQEETSEVKELGNQKVVNQ